MEAHDMGILACHLALRIKGERADFDFPASYFKTMAATKAICDKDNVHLPQDLVDKKMKVT